MQDSRHFIDFENNLDGGLSDVLTISPAVGSQATSPDPIFSTLNSSLASRHTVSATRGSDMANHVPHLISAESNPPAQTVSTAPVNSDHLAILALRQEQVGGIVDAITNFLYRHPLSRVSVDVIQHTLTLCMERVRHDLVIPVSGVPIMGHGLCGSFDGLVSTPHHTHPMDTSTWSLPSEFTTRRDVSQMDPSLTLSGQVPGIRTAHETQVPSGGRELVNSTEYPSLPRGFSNNHQAVETPAQQCGNGPLYSERQLEQPTALIPHTRDMGSEHHCPDLSRVPIAAARGRRFIRPRTVCTLCNLELSKDSLKRHIRECHKGKKRKASCKKVCSLATRVQSAEHGPSAST